MGILWAVVLGIPWLLYSKTVGTPQRTYKDFFISTLGCVTKADTHAHAFDIIMYFNKKLLVPATAQAAERWLRE
jgi:hypothetical protein